MARCEICGQQVMMQMRGGRARGNYCMDCFSNIAADMNYPMLYREAMNLRKKKQKPKRLCFAFFGHFDIKTDNKKNDFLLKTFAKTHMKKWSKHDRMIIVLLTESYDNYWNDFRGGKGIYSSLKKAVKKITVNNYLLSTKFLRRERSQESILKHFTKILDDLLFLTGQQDEVSFLLTNGLPFHQDFLQLYYSSALEKKNITKGNIFEITNTNAENMGNKSEIIEISLKEDVNTQAEESLINTYREFLKMILEE